MVHVPVSKGRAGLLLPDNVSVVLSTKSQITTSFPALAFVTAGRTVIKTVSVVAGQVAFEMLHTNL